MENEPPIKGDPFIERSGILLSGVVHDVLANPDVPDEVRDNRSQYVQEGHGYFPCPHCQGLIVLAMAMLPMPKRDDKLMLVAMYVPGEIAESIPIMDPGMN